MTYPTPRKDSSKQFCIDPEGQRKTLNYGITSEATPDGACPFSSIQPCGYRPAGGSTVYLGGQNAVDAKGSLIGEASVAEQARYVLRNVKLALAATGATFNDVVQWNVLLVDGIDINGAYAAISPELASDQRPLVSAAFVSQLGIPGALLKISAVDALIIE